LLGAQFPYVIAQNISGQWIGKFTSEEDPGGGGTTMYWKLNQMAASFQVTPIPISH
jgi:hypothetical protein